MIFSTLISIGLATATMPSVKPEWLIAPSKNYENCIFDAIDQQYATGQFSEKVALSECVTVRRTQIDLAKAALTEVSGPSDGEELINREFTRLDESVWIIIGHLKDRNHRQQSVR